jgi:hypothetical protein
MIMRGSENEAGREVGKRHVSERGGGKEGLRFFSSVAVGR